MNTYYLFGATFGVVFMLGFQSLSVQSGNYPLAAINSVVIGIFNLALLKTVPFVDAPLQVAVYIIAGPCGIVTSMLVHRKIVTPWREHSARRKAAAAIASTDHLEKAFWSWFAQTCPVELADDVRDRWINSPSYRNASKGL